MRWELKGSAHVHDMPHGWSCVVQETVLGNWNWSLTNADGRVVMTGLDELCDYAKEVAVVTSTAYFDVKLRHAREGMLAAMFAAKLLDEL